MNEKLLNSKEFKELSKGILKLKNTVECKKFFRDLCTITELTAMTERFEVAKRVYAKQAYRKVSKETGTSTATITRISYWLRNGLGGYKLVLNRLSVPHHHNSSSFGKGLH